MAGEDTSALFRDKLIWREGRRYTGEQGRYPVIHLTFKDARGLTWKDVYGYLQRQIEREFQRHDELSRIKKLNGAKRANYEHIASGNALPGDWALSLATLAECLHDHHGIAPIVLIDEYDTPVQQGHLKGFYEDVISFMRQFIPSALKDNEHVSFACLTGITRVAKESIFSGLNNVRIDSMLDERFSEFFGFTPDEVRQLLERRGFADRYPQAIEWYDGYSFGGQKVLNPWSIVNYIDNGCKPGAYWTMTGNNDVIGELFNVADEEVLERLDRFMRGESVRVMVDTSVAFPHLADNPSLVFSFLLMAGYLCVVDDEWQPEGYHLCNLRIPNREIAMTYASETIAALPGPGSKAAGMSIREALVTADSAMLQKQLDKFLREVASYHDTASESFYHGMVIGICAALDNHYSVRSNRESGAGRFDVQLTPRSGGMPGIVIEIKASKGAGRKKLEGLASEAVEQVSSNKYATELWACG